jgi:membrane protein
MLNVKKILHKKIQFYKEDIWKIHTSRESNISFFDRVIKMFLAGGRKFNNKGCLHKASALTYYTLLSLVPVLAMVFGIAKGFGYEKTLENILLQKFEDKKDILIQIFNLANSLLENTHGGMIA